MDYLRGCMMLKNKYKTLIRWICISFSFLFYYFVVGVVGAISSDKDIVYFTEKNISIEYHRASMEIMQEHVNLICWASFISFPVCMIMILFFFKKIR